MLPRQLAIDFGTTNTVAAVLRDGGAVPLRLSTSGNQMPSGVLARPDGTLLVGEPALNEAAMYLESFEPNPKLRLGHEVVYLAGRDWSPIELVGAVLAKVRETADRVTGGAMDEAVVLTHPAAWETHLRDRLLEAALLAGFSAVTMVSEPIAAARWYASHHGGNGHGASATIRRGDTLGVFDFGGGTCDVAVLRAADDRAEEFEVLASGGDPYLGGEEIDRVMMEWAIDQALDDADDEERARIEDERDHGREWFTFRDLVRRAKHTLSESDEAGIPFSLGGVRRSLRLSREDFDELLRPHMDRAMTLTHAVIGAAGTTPGDFASLPGGAAGLYLTGGSALIPVVRDRLSELLHRAPAQLDDPKTVVPMGALVAPRVDVERSGAVVEPPPRAAPSLLQDELAGRVSAERRARPAGEPASSGRIAELEREIARLRAAVEGPPPSSQPTRETMRPPPPPPPPHTGPTPTPAPTPATPVPTSGGLGRFVSGLAQILAALFLAAVGDVAIDEGTYYGNDVTIVIGGVLIVGALLLLWRGVRTMWRAKAASR